MKMRLSVCGLLTLFCGFIASIAFTAETLTNSSIVDLHKLGLGETVIVEKIKASTCTFDTSTDALKKLKDAGVSDTVIAAMISGSGPKSVAAGGDPNDPKSPHPTGIYVVRTVDGKTTMATVGASLVTGVRTAGGWGVGWGGTAKSRAVLEGLSAPLQLSAGRPTFYFYLTAGMDSIASSPEQFALVQLELKKDKNERRLVVGKAGWGGAKFGVDQKSMRPFSTEKIAEGIYKVTPDADLAAGEYAFVLPAGGSVSRMFDFGVR